MNKYLGINQTKQVKDEHIENYEVLMEEVKDDLNKWKVLHSWIRKIYIGNVIICKVIHRFTVIAIKIPMAFFSEMGMVLLKFIWNYKGPSITKTGFLVGFFFGGGRSW